MTTPITITRNGFCITTTEEHLIKLLLQSDPETRESKPQLVECYVGRESYPDGSGYTYYYVADAYFFGTWREAKEYGEKIGYRLPTVSEVAFMSRSDALSVIVDMSAKRGGAELFWLEGNPPNYCYDRNMVVGTTAHGGRAGAFYIRSV